MYETFVNPGNNYVLILAQEAKTQAAVMMRDVDDMRTKVCDVLEYVRAHKNDEEATTTRTAIESIARDVGSLEVKVTDQATQLSSVRRDTDEVVAAAKNAAMTQARTLEQEATFQAQLQVGTKVSVS